MKIVKMPNIVLSDLPKEVREYVSDMDGRIIPSCQQEDIIKELPEGVIASDEFNSNVMLFSRAKIWYKKNDETLQILKVETP